MSQHQRTADKANDQLPEGGDQDRLAPQQERRFELSLSQILAGSLAAASAAVAASWLGVAGTVLGAVVASIVVPVSTALYSHPLERSSQVLRESLPVRAEGYRSAEKPPTRPRGAVPQQRQQVAPRTGSSGRPSRRRIRWGTVAVSCLMTLAVGFGLLTALEEVMGRSFSSLTGSGGHGGTTVSRLVEHGNGGSAGDPEPTPATDTTPTTGADQSTAPTTDPATTAPATTAAATTEPPTTAPTTTAPPTTTGPPTTAQSTGTGAVQNAATGAPGG